VRFADESDLLGLPEVASVSEKRVTTKAGTTRLSHHVCKNVGVEVRVASSSALDLTHCVVTAQLMFDARSSPLKLVEIGHSNTPMRCTVLVQPHLAILLVKIGVLSSQVDGELFRLRIEARDEAGATHVVYSAPLYVVSKPYLALRAEGDKSKPKPASHRDTTAKSATRGVKTRRAVAATSSSAVAVSAGNENNVNNSGKIDNDVLSKVMAEQAAQRRLLEQLVRNSHSSNDEATHSGNGKRRRAQRHTYDDDDDDEDENDDDEEYNNDDNDDDEEYVAEPKRRRLTATTSASTVSRKSLPALRRTAAQHVAHASPARDNDDDDESMSSVAPAPQQPQQQQQQTETTSVLPVSPVKTLSAAIDALVVAFDGVSDIESRNATLCALLPTRVSSVLTGHSGLSSDTGGACALFGAQGCPHARQLAQFDAACIGMFDSTSHIDHTGELRFD